MPVGRVPGSVPTAPTAVVHTTHLRLRPLTDADVADERIQLWHTDPEGYTLMHEEPRTPAAARDFLQEAADKWKSAGHSYWVAERAGEPVGVGGVRQLNYQEQDYFNLYYRLAPEARGHGYATEIARAAVGFAAEQYPALPVVARIAPANTPSLRTAQRSGLSDLGGRRFPGDPIDLPPPLLLQGPVISFGDPDDAGREAMLDLWCRVNDADGAVGFEPGATRDEVAVPLNRSLSHPAYTLVRLHLPTPETWADRSRTGPLAAFGFVESFTGPRVRHRCKLVSVMVDPALQGKGIGHVLVGALHGRAQRLGHEMVEIGYRGGTGLEHFYRHFGYAECARVPDGLRFSFGDRDDVTMLRRLAPLDARSPQ